jgi:hypothetical protein
VDEVFMVILVFSIPIVAIVGGVVSGIVKSLGQQRLLEMAQRERMMAIERGIPPEKLPPIQFPPEMLGGGLTFEQTQLRRSHGLMIGGLITAAIGIALVLMFQLIPDAAEQNVWAAGLVPLFVGIACLIGAVIVRPRSKL